MADAAVKPALGFAGAIVLVVLAVLAALLAADVRAWQTTLREDDALVASTPRLATWEPATHLSSLALFLENANVPIRFDNGRQVAVARSRAEQALAAVARHSSGPRASQAETLLGVLVFTDVGPSTDPFQVSTGTDPDQAQASLADFDDAVRTDPGNAFAKYDLELVLRSLIAQGVRIGPGQQTGSGSIGQRGAGGGVPGGGY